MNPIEQLLQDRADAMAAHDGVPAAAVHLHGAANQLVIELQGVRDRLIHALLHPWPGQDRAEEATKATPKPKTSAGRAKKVAAAEEAEPPAEPAAVEPQAEVGEPKAAEVTE